MQINGQNTGNLIPTHFLTVYSRNGSDPYMEIGEFIKHGNKYKVGPSVPVDLEFLNNLAATVKTENFQSLKFSGLTPSNVLYHHSDDNYPTIFWIMERSKKKIYFDPDMNIKSGLYEFPNTLFFCQDGNLACFRLEDNYKADENLKLYMMPLPNINNHSDVCLGDAQSNKAKPKSLEEYIEQMETFFFQTKFNAWHHEKFGEEASAEELLKRKNLNEFPLVAAHKKTLKQILNGLS